MKEENGTHPLKTFFQKTILLSRLLFKPESDANVNVKLQ